MPLVMSKAEWARIMKWTDPNKENPEVVRQREYVRRLDTISKEMTRDWPNSLENMNKRNEELRRARLEIAEQTNAKFYKRYVRRQREQQQRLMHSARDIIFKNKDAPKLLLSAVIETTIQKERSEQLKFRVERKREEVEQKRKDDDEVIRRAADWHALQAEKRRQRFLVNKQHQKEILDQAHEVSERKRIEYETELNYQKKDNMEADKQMAAIAEFEANFKAEEKARIWSDMKRSKEEADARHEEVAARDRLDDKLQEVLMRSRARTEDKRRRTEKEVKDEKLRILEKISQRLESGDAAREDAERAAREKAIAEKEAVAEARLLAQKRKQEEFVRVRRESRAQFLAQQEQKQHEFNTRRQWEIMNRFKNAELYEDFQEQLRKEKERKIKEFREETLRLWKERADREARERAETRYFYGELAMQKLRDADNKLLPASCWRRLRSKERADREARERAETRYFYGELAMQKLRDADNKLLTHAAGLLEEAKRHNRPDLAIRKGIDRYCKLYRLYPMPELPKSMQEHFGSYAPWDGSAPDAGYQEPPPPPPDRGPDAPDEPEEAPPPEEKRDGMQPVDKAGPSKPLETAEESVEDYKRASRANGLQRRDAQPDLKLPRIVPCQTPGCDCDLKK
ncbi:hypothetical protein MSG28_013426 [Choristoneura fumiferana]|uniref:Uncharacterized protein n=1 Tax=Choristoneura fumiferana TaxID=7141 RepID=A0ACC0KTC8_CHOFU|nr:hypothetical protein MSG28_013426 [Choristoneura fumiferana]